MKYEIQIKGMHCKGCQNLIKMSLEELELLEVDVDLIRNTGIFKSDKSSEELDKVIEEMFQKDLVDYKFISLKKI